MASKTAMITIVGRPNVGKSTLTNRLVGEKVAIVSHKPQTTRNRICGIVNRADTQFIFVDTPGFHKPRTKLGDYMVNVTRQSVSDVDAVILMVEPIAHVGRQEEALLNQLRQAGEPVILAINKIDTVERMPCCPSSPDTTKSWNLPPLYPSVRKAEMESRSFSPSAAGLPRRGPTYFRKTPRPISRSGR